MKARFNLELDKLKVRIFDFNKVRTVPFNKLREFLFNKVRVSPFNKQRAVLFNKVRIISLLICFFIVFPIVSQATEK